MIFTKINNNFIIDDILLRVIENSDLKFIDQLFNDAEMGKYYILPNQLINNPIKILESFFKQNKSKTEVCWIISKRKTNFFTKNRSIGILVLDISQNLKTAIISYGLLSEFRKKGYMKKSLTFIINFLKECGIELIAADVNVNNIQSIKVLKSLGFIQENTLLIDPLSLNAQNSNERFLWTLSFSEPNVSNDGLFPYKQIKEELEKFSNICAKEGKLNQTLSIYKNYLVKYIEDNFKKRDIELFEHKVILTISASFFKEIKLQNPTVHNPDSSIYSLVSLASGLACDEYKINNNFTPTILSPLTSPIENEISSYQNLIKVYGKPRDLTNYSILNFKILSKDECDQVINQSTDYQLRDEQVLIGNIIAGIIPKIQKTGKFHMNIVSRVNEKLLNISNNNTNFYNISFELVREERLDNNRFLIFSGWGDTQNGGHQQFEGIEFAVPIEHFVYYLGYLLKHNSEYFTREILDNIIGLEGLNKSQ